MTQRTYIGELVKFVPSMLLSTNAVNEGPVWTAGTYGIGDIVIREVLIGNGYMRNLPALRKFESLVATNTAIPGEDETKWQDIGPANTVACFDGKVSTRTSYAGTLAMEVAPASLATVVAFFNLVGQEITLIARDVDDAVVFDDTRSLVAEEVTDWFDWFHAPFDQLDRVVFTDVPIYTTSTIEITVTPRGGTAGIGHVCFALPRDIGYSPLAGASVGTDDYSVKETDEFGDTTFVERPSSDFQNIAVLTENTRLGYVKRLLTRMRATPCMLIASESAELAEVLINYGWIGTHTVAINHASHSLIDVEFKGLT